MPTLVEMSADTTADRPADGAGMRPVRRRGRRTVIAAALVVIVAAGVGLVAWRAVPERWLPWDTAEFPQIDAAELTPAQRRVVEAVRHEHTAQRPGTFYSEGVDEPWCANFVSWIMRAAGSPLVNPHSGHWRIPGVYTLQEYYEAAGRFDAVGEQPPRVGDVVLYDRSSGFGQHTNIVVAVDGESAVTVGGNEMGRIRVHSLDWRSDGGVVGFGRGLPG